MPQYIISKLGLDRDPLCDLNSTTTDSDILGQQVGDEEDGSTAAATVVKDKSRPSHLDGYLTDDKPKWPECRDAPREDDFETIRVSE